MENIIILEIPKEISKAIQQFVKSGKQKGKVLLSEIDKIRNDYQLSNEQNNYLIDILHQNRIQVDPETSDKDREFMKQYWVRWANEIEQMLNTIIPLYNAKFHNFTYGINNNMVSVKFCDNEGNTEFDFCELKDITRIIIDTDQFQLEAKGGYWHCSDWAGLYFTENEDNEDNEENNIDLTGYII